MVPARGKMTKQSVIVTALARTSTLDTSSDHAAGNALRFENAARLFFNGELGEATSWHADINLIYDTQGVEEYWRGHENYTQYG